MNKQQLIDVVNKYKRSPAIKLIAALLVLRIMYDIYVWSNTESTDNAYIDADISTIGAEINGVVHKINATNNSLIKAGDVVAEISDQDYQASFAQAEASYNASLSNIKLIEQKINTEEINLEKNKEALDLAKTDFDTAAADFNRTTNLVKDSYTSKKALDNARSTYEKAKTGYLQAKLNVKLSEQNLTTLAVEKSCAESNSIASLQGKKLAEKKLANTKIISPINGIIANSNLRLGNYVSPGIPLFSVVPIDKIRVVANFKETQVEKFRPGMLASISFDAMNKEVIGTIQSISPATGSKFSLFPADNATGNFTKIVQRVPVWIEFELKEELKKTIMPGMSAIVKVATNQRVSRD